MFCAAIFGKSPAGLACRVGLSQKDASFLQFAAADAVLVDPTPWAST